MIAKAGFKIAQVSRGKADQSLLFESFVQTAGGVSGVQGRPPVRDRVIKVNAQGKVPAGQTNPSANTMTNP